MKRQKKVSIYLTLIGFPILTVIPFALNFYYPKPLFILSLFSLIFFIAALVALLGPLAKQRIGGSDALQKSRQAVWLLQIFSIILAICIIFFGEVIFILNNNVQLNYISNVESTHLLTELIKNIFLNGALLPWSFLAVVATTFAVQSAEQHPYHPFSQYIPKVKSKTLFGMLRRTIDGYVETSTRIFFAISFACFIAQISYSTGVNQLNMLNGTLAFFIMLMLPYSRQFKKIALKIEEKKISPGLIFFSLITMMIILNIIIRILLNILIAKNPTSSIALLSYQTPDNHLVIAAQSWHMSWYLWIWSWWVLAAPLSASLFVKVSQGRSIRSLILAILAVSSITGIIFHLIGSNNFINFVWFLQSGHIALILQLTGVLLLLALFISPQSYHILWFGFIPSIKPSKLRLAPFKKTWLLIISAFGAFMVANLQGLLLVQSITGIGLFIFLLFAIRYR